MNLTERAKNIILKPKQEWPAIDGEAIQTSDFYRNYIIPLAAIGPIASFIGTSLVGITLPGMGTFRVPIGSAIVQMIVSFVLALIGVYVLAIIIDLLAPSFGGENSRHQGLKVAAYSSTPGWLGGIFGIIPVLGFVGIIAAIYGLYLLYLGLPILMKSPRQKALGYTVIVVIASIVIFVIIGLITSMFVNLPVPNIPTSE
ncbi:YIP1 family protein [Desulfobacterota bacterium AH_259_B03_O07]|nr:YIP1 family protein [Desulfobacterota bacterium AH_259_B03_O07]